MDIRKILSSDDLVVFTGIKEGKAKLVTNNVLLTVKSHKQYAKSNSANTCRESLQSIPRFVNKHTCLQQNFKIAFFLALETFKLEESLQAKA